MGQQKEAFNPFKAYHKYVGSKPLLDTAALGGAGTFLGYYGSNLLLNPLVGLLARATNATPDKVKKVQAMIRRLGALAGGVGGAAYSAGKHMDTGSGIKGAIKSMYSGDYWKDNPDALARRQKSIMENVLSGKKSIRTPDLLKSLLPEPVKDTIPTREELEMADLRRKEMERQMHRQRLEDVRAGLQKNQSYSDPFAGKTVPVDYAMTVIQQDPFLSLGKKEITKGIFRSGEENGQLSGPGIMTGALRFGAGAIPAYLLGKNMLGMLSLDEKKVKTLSGVGGIAVGVMNTGIFGDE